MTVIFFTVTHRIDLWKSPATVTKLYVQCNKLIMNTVIMNLHLLWNDNLPMSGE